MAAIDAGEELPFGELRVDREGIRNSQGSLSDPPVRWTDRHRRS